MKHVFRQLVGKLTARPAVSRRNGMRDEMRRGHDTVDPGPTPIAACRQALAEQNWDGLSLACDQVLEDGRIDDAARFELGITLRNAGAYDAAVRVLSAVVERDPEHAEAVYALALSFLLQARHDEAVELLAGFIARHPDDQPAVPLIVRGLYALGRKTEADGYVESVRRYDNQHHFSILKSFGDYIDRFPLHRSQAIIDGVLSRSPFASMARVKDEILAAKAQRRPFAFLRLGDGEGSFTKLNLLDELDFAPLYESNRQAFYSLWFGAGRESFRPSFDVTTGALASAIEEADIVGLPLPSWVEHEYRIGSWRGVSALTNIYRLAEKMQADGRPLCTCAQSMHIELGQSDLFEALLGGEARIGVISCFTELPERLQQAFNIKDVDFYKLPGEQFFKSIIGTEATAGQHYPTVFNTVMGSLKKRQDGKIFLVAGGILGKFYVQQIKRSGGIALDVGSLADAWVKKLTRPGYETLEDVAL